MKEVVIEYITGFDCETSAHVNKLLKSEKEKYKDDCELILIGIHDLVSSDDHQQMINCITNGQTKHVPVVRINRSEGQWYDMLEDQIGEEIMQNQLEKESVLKIKMTTWYDNNYIHIDYELKYKKEFNENLIKFVLLEDNISAPQRIEEDEIDENYIHNNVFKQIILNEKINNPKKGEVFFGKIKKTLDQRIFSDINNCRIVCYILNGEDVLGGLSSSIMQKNVKLFFRRIKNRIRKFWLKIL
jgi:hypothetical protein